ncbi:MAG: Na+/H+ antiporter NhaA [Deltaproteobacteria bacterium]|nr:Na+/H+ antiporter NhaA [Deltaproteobacteria bacterium]
MKLDSSHEFQLRGVPPEASRTLVRAARAALRPIDKFLHIEAASGIVLLLAAAVALLWANSGWHESYTAFWHTRVGFAVGGFAFFRSLEWVVNDGLMVIFFFVVGMEIRRELHHGELSQWRRAAVPVLAALGGMLVPATLYLAVAGAPATRDGWGVPMATDIAFALGALTLLGKRVPPALRVLLLAVAVIDDLGAIIVIALFYSESFALHGLLIAAGGFGGIFLMQAIGVRAKPAYIAPAVVAWAGVYIAGVHPTIAGVLVGVVTPVRAWLGTEGFIAGVRSQLAKLSSPQAQGMTDHDWAESLRRVDLIRREAMSPAESLIQALHPWVAFGIMPIFALANAGVRVTGEGVINIAVASAVAVGLLIGKPVGVFAAAWLAVRLGVGALPRGIGNRHLLVLGAVAGVGFTMALFIAQLAFSDLRLLAAAKLGVLGASVVAGLVALALGRWLLPERHPDDCAQTAYEAEVSSEL